MSLLGPRSQLYRHAPASRLLLLLAAVNAVIFGLSACSDQPDSRTTDIFLEDRGDEQTGNARRHPATNDEKLWTISMNGCTGHLIAPELMMTANHCSPRAGARYTSGYASTQNQRNDITVTRVVEQNASLDYAILQIQWTGGYPSQQRFPPLVSTQASDVQASQAANQGDELFTVGFPGDKARTWGATYSEGHAKQVAGTRLVYNVGIINGNSGGGVWRKRDKMLVSLTNNGPHSLGQAGWDSASAQESRNWNFGTGMWQIYAASATLRDVFPGGRNRFGGAGAEAGTLFAAIGQADGAATDSYTMHFTAPETATRGFFCTTARAADCRDGASGYSVATLGTAIGDRAHFRGHLPTVLSNGIVLSFLALDARGQIVASRSFRMEAP